jgi:hypothetical protein
MATPVRNGSELRDLVLWAQEQGFTCDVTNAAHLVFRRPGTPSVYASYTPSCKFARRHTRRDLLRALKVAAQRLAEGANPEDPTVW